MSNTIINLFRSQTDGISQSKVSEITPFLLIVAEQNNLNLAKYGEFRKAVLLLKLSIIFN
jgi:hypothetical protein